MAKLELIGFPQSTFVWSVRMALHVKGVDYGSAPDTPHSEPVDAIHPFGRIPAMRHGDVALCESRAIVEYIDRAFDGPPLRASDPKTAAQEEMWASIAMTAVDQALIRKHFFAYFMPGTPDGKPDPARVAEAVEGSKKACAALERGIGDGLILGAECRFPDFWLVPQLHYARTLPDWDAITTHTPGLREATTRALGWGVTQATMPPPLPAREKADA